MTRPYWMKRPGVLELAARKRGVMEVLLFLSMAVLLVIDGLYVRQHYALPDPPTQEWRAKMVPAGVCFTDGCYEWTWEEFLRRMHWIPEQPKDAAQPKDDTDDLDRYYYSII